MKEEDIPWIQKARSTTILKKNHNHKENSLYPDQTPKCYIGNGNNSEL
jgi:hypothetical protein